VIRALVLGAAVVAVAPGSAAARRHCYDPSTTIGVSRCARYGQWDSESPVAFELALVERSIDLGHVDTIVATTDYLGDLGTVHATGAMLRFYAHVATHFYIGAFVGAAGIGDAPPITFSSTDAGPGFTGRDGALISDGMLVGAHVTLGRLTLAGELAPEMNLYTLAGSDVVGGLVTRVLADVWLTPAITLGVLVGVNVLDRRDLSTGINVGVHFSAFDATR